MKQEGEGALLSAQTTQRLAEEQLKAAQAHEMSIRESQKQLAAVSLDVLYVCVYVHMCRYAT